MEIFFRIIAGLGSFVSLYMFLCFARVIITWIPQLAYSKIGQFLAALCDPYLNSFSRFKFLRTPRIDFSPVVSLGILVLVSSILGNIAASKHFSFGLLIAVIIRMAWSIAGGLLGFFNLLLLIRLIFNLIGKDTNQAVWAPVDNVLGPVIVAVSKFIHRSKFVTYRNSLITALISLFAVQFIGSFIVSMTASFFGSLPF